MGIVRTASASVTSLTEEIHPFQRTLMGLFTELRDFPVAGRYSVSRPFANSRHFSRATGIVLVVTMERSRPWLCE